MHKRIIAGAAGIVVLLASMYAILWRTWLPKVDNITSADELITQDCSLESIYVLQALFSARGQFHEVDVGDLAREANVRLQCKRQLTHDCYYYIVQGHGLRCFLFTDDEDNVQNIIAAYRFLTLDELRAIAEDLAALYPTPIRLTELQSNSLDSTAYSCAYHQRVEYACILARDGLVIEEAFSPSSGKFPVYHYYTYEEWPAAEAIWQEKVPSWSCNCQILPLDLVWDESE